MHAYPFLLILKRKLNNILPPFLASVLRKDLQLIKFISGVCMTYFMNFFIKCKTDIPWRYLVFCPILSQ